MKQQFRRLATTTAKSVILNEDEIDIYEYDRTPIPNWKPNTKIKPLADVSKLYLDIETTGLNPASSDIVLIGLKNERGKSHIIDCKTHGEYYGLIEFIEILNKKKPEILLTFNGFKFDIPFIINKLEKYRIPHAFYINKDRVKVFKTAQMFSQPTEYNDIWLRRGETAIIDLFHQSLAWDFLNHKLTRFGLKHIPNQLNLPGYENDKPIELSFPQMQQAIANWDNRSPTKGVTGKELLSEYLESDLKATKAIGDFLLPDIYYQKLILPDWNLQSLATSGNGSKWNDILKQYYNSKGSPPPQTSPKLTFVGALTGSKPGLFKNIAKIDVASLYPSIMLLYGVCSDKDPDRHCLAVLKFLKDERLRLKAIAKEKKGTPEGQQANQAQGALKVLINSAYGFMSTGFIEYNDFVAGAGVTAHGRAILKRMMSALEEYGVISACFTGDTVVMTDTGDFSIIDILNKPVKVLNINGDWVSTMFTSYGVAKNLMEVVIKRKNEEVAYRCTPNHRWYVREKDASINVYTTDKLKQATKESGSGMKLPHIMPVNPDMDFEYQEGLLHGIVYGDGHLQAKNQDGRYRLRLDLYGEKAELADKFFYSAYSTVISQSTDKRHAGSVSLRIKSRVNYKELPHPASDVSYLYGFIAGLIATDGSVNTKKTGVRITGKKETIDYVASISNRCGLNVSNINISTTKQQSGYTTTKSDTWYISFETSTVEKELLERKFHRDKFEPSESNPDWRVISVRHIPESEEVFCCVEPITNTFVLSTGCITGNSQDTDGVFFASDDPTFAKNKEAWKYCQSKMPETIELEYELEALAMYCPPNESNSDEGLRKNYVYVYKDKSGDIKVKSKGKFVKRDKCVLEKSFIPEIVRRYATDGTHEIYYQQILMELLTCEYPLKNLAITRKIKANESRVVELGLGKHGDVITIYKERDKELHGRRGQVLKKTEVMWTDDPKKIDWAYYVNILNEMWEQFLRCPKY